MLELPWHKATTEVGHKRIADRDFSVELVGVEGRNRGGEGSGGEEGRCETHGGGVMNSSLCTTIYRFKKALGTRNEGQEPEASLVITGSGR